MPELLPTIIVIIILNSKPHLYLRACWCAGMQVGFSTVRDTLQLALGA